MRHMGPVTWIHGVRPRLQPCFSVDSSVWEGSPVLKLQVLTGVTGVILLLGLALGGCSSDGSGPGSSASSVDGCPDGTLVKTADQLTDALAAVEPGGVIVMAAGTYRGTFVADRSGTSDAPIVLCGEASAVLDAGTVDTGYTLHLDGVQHWRVQGMTLRQGAKGLVLDGSSDNQIVGIAVEGTGEEAVHLRTNSSRNLVQGIRVAGTGVTKPDIGEGIYVGTAESNWCRLTDCQPDRSDENQIIGNTVEGTTAEPVDIKEGTSGGVLKGNTLNGSDASTADSLIDLKGNGWTVEGTTGTASPGNGVAVFEILEGWGRDNVLRGNTFEVAADAFAVEVFGAARSNGNVVDCSNRVAGAADRISNVDCTS